MNILYTLVSKLHLFCVLQQQQQKPFGRSTYTHCVYEQIVAEVLLGTNDDCDKWHVKITYWIMIVLRRILLFHCACSICSLFVTLSFVFFLISIYIYICGIRVFMPILNRYRWCKKSAQSESKSAHLRTHSI